MNRWGEEESDCIEGAPERAGSALSGSMVVYSGLPHVKLSDSLFAIFSPLSQAELLGVRLIWMFSMFPCFIWRRSGRGVVIVCGVSSAFDCIQWQERWGKAGKRWQHINNVSQICQCDACTHSKTPEIVLEGIYLDTKDLQTFDPNWESQRRFANVEIYSMKNLLFELLKTVKEVKWFLVICGYLITLPKHLWENTSLSYGTTLLIF